MPYLILADDNPTTQRIFELSLAEEELRLSCHENAQAALEAAQQDSPDLVFVHLDIPELGGYELSRQIKAAPETTDATIVMLGGAFQGFDTEKAKECGCVHYLSKPFETSTLLKLIRDLLENPPCVKLAKPRFLFELPLQDCVTQTVFDLDGENCSPAWASLGRDVAVPVHPDFEALARKYPAGFGGEESDTAGPAVDPPWSPPPDVA